MGKHDVAKLFELLKEFKSQVDKDTYEKACGEYLLNDVETEFTNFLNSKDVVPVFTKDLTVLEDITCGVRRNIVLEFNNNEEYTELHIMCMKGHPRLKKVKYDVDEEEGEF
ncbi:MAG: hypothetical protein ACI4PU_10185 [Intestinibacter sp.]